MTNQNETMEEQLNKIKNLEYRRKRVKRIKRFFVTCIVILVLIPSILCGFLMVQMYRMNRTLGETQEKLWELTVQMEDANAAAVVEQMLSPVQVMDDDIKAVIPDAQMYEGKKRIYLTFDDGPSTYTNEILDILAQYDVKATFFVVAKEGYEDEYNRIVEEGHTLALHSYTHQYSQIYESPQAFRQDVVQLSDFLFDITGYRCEVYRFPGGSSNSIIRFDKDECFDVLEEEGLVYFDWNVTSKDASSYRLSSQAILNNVLSGTAQTDSSVVLMHDASDKYTTVQALPKIIEQLQTDENTVFLPITDGTTPVCHVIRSEEDSEE